MKSANEGFNPPTDLKLEVYTTRVEYYLAQY